jgi:hypothetical protein
MLHHTISTTAAARTHYTWLPLMFIRTLVSAEWEAGNPRRQSTFLDASWAHRKESTIVQIIHEGIWEQAPLPLSILSSPAPMILKPISNMCDRFSFAEFQPATFFRIL